MKIKYKTITYVYLSVYTRLKSFVKAGKYTTEVYYSVIQVKIKFKINVKK